jgi:hypothetical protein
MQKTNKIHIFLSPVYNSGGGVYSYLYICRQVCVMFESPSDKDCLC